MISAVAISIAKEYKLSKEDVRALSRLEEITDKIYKLEIVKGYVEEESKKEKEICKKIRELKSEFRLIEENVNENVITALEKIEHIKDYITFDYFFYESPSCHEEAGALNLAI